MMLILGPLLYLYSHSIINVEFSFTGKSVIHFIPYVIGFILNLPFLIMDKASKIKFLEIFTSQQLPIDMFSIVLFSFQSLHLSIYLLVTINFLRKQVDDKNNYVVSFESRKKWLNILIICLSSFLSVVVLLLIYIIYTGILTPISNYSFTVVLSAIIFVISYNFTFRREIIDADFVERYKSVKFSENEMSNYVTRLNSLMESEKYFLDPDLKLADVADKMGITPHQLSKLINQEIGKNFPSILIHIELKKFKKNFLTQSIIHFRFWVLQWKQGLTANLPLTAHLKKLRAALLPNLKSE